MDELHNTNVFYERNGRRRLIKEIRDTRSGRNVFYLVYEQESEDKWKLTRQGNCGVAAWNRWAKFAKQKKR